MSSDEQSVASDAPEQNHAHHAPASDTEPEMDDLFGDEDGDEEQPRRHLDDDDLDSGDDEGRNDRRQSPTWGATPPPESQEQEDLQIMPLNIPRHVIPEPSDNELYLLKVPRFLAFEPQIWDPHTFAPPTTEHHSKEAPAAAFSPYNTAITTMRWRECPSNPDELQSNARILRWSDGSLTIQLATDATVQYELPGKPLAPPQMNPPKPTPTSNRDARGRIIKPTTGYDAGKDTFTYLGAGQATAYCVRTTNKITTALSVQNSAKADSLESLQASMAAVTAKFSDPTGRRGVQIQDIRGDPEKDKLEAIEAEKQKMRAQRRLENQQKREQERSSRVLGGRSGRGTGLTVGGLEDDEDGGVRHRMSRGKPSARGSGKTRRDEYSEEEEEMYGRLGGPQDNYVKDDFMVDDDEIDSGGDESEDEDAEGEDDEDVVESRERRPSPKRVRADEERATTQASPVSRTKRRRIVDSDEDE